ncbi:c-di-GMP-binding flagellar brake protein YcgR, contains PilZNR and PilZ domains [Clostridium acidisoli DSM 12555]|uniref:C-di-GMP-binding flagellar brake protein YcgR, contains PilZNR and PilZ domains n=1 Tax=Clostridium acidisoli DSM 12555 TaxID=1121291 RepID=A0A1W1X1D2_9CLOT|nr:flagellar brake domain-containing protein [Clostridium acidisoli]SMC17776.1 c-di-GMP-binding flagellar brake protein YcgR, contains PilZNR and PilZ domains [Clostridium acidisoli DSM 12555]
MKNNNVEININTKCEVLIKGKSYKSNIQDIYEKDIAISIPVFKNNYANLLKDEEVEVIYYDEKNVYGFQSKVTGRKNDGISMILIEKPDKIKKVQRRRFFRMDLSMEVEYKKIEDNLSDNQINAIIEENKDFSICTMVDLSGGGIRIRTKDDIDENQLYIIKIPLKDEVIYVTCYCVRVIRDSIAKSNVCGFSFYDIEDSKRDRIISYLFQLMRELRKKE